MDDKEKRTLIFDPENKIIPAISDVASECEIEIINTIEEDNSDDLVIIVDSIEDYRKHNKAYPHARIIFLGEGHNLGEFFNAKGELILDPKWIEFPMGKEMLKNYLLNESSVKLNERYSFFTSFNTFKILSHVRVGSELDQLCYQAFKSGYNPVTVRTLFESLMYYFYYLKQDELARFPLEVDYASDGTCFVAQFHFKAEHIKLEYLLDGLIKHQYNKNSKQLLAMATENCDFLDIEFVSGMNKVLITAHWLQLDFHNSLTSSSLKISKVPSLKKSLENEKVNYNFSESPAVKQEDVKKIVDKNLPESPVFKRDVNTKEIMASSEFIGKISASTNDDALVDQMDKILEEDDNADILDWIEGQDIPEAIFVDKLENDVTETFVRVKGRPIKDDMIRRISSKVLEETDKIIVSGNFEDTDDFIARISSQLEKEIKGSEVVKGKVLGEKIPDLLRVKMGDYAKQLGLADGKMTVKHFKDFATEKLSDVLSAIVKVDSEHSIKAEMLKQNPELKFKHTFEQQLRKNWQVKNPGISAKSLSGDEKRTKFRQTYDSTLESVFVNQEADSFQLQSPQLEAVIEKGMFDVLKDDVPIKNIMDETRDIKYEESKNQELEVLRSENQKLQNQLAELRDRVTDHVDYAAPLDTNVEEVAHQDEYSARVDNIAQNISDLDQYMKELTSFSMDEVPLEEVQDFVQERAQTVYESSQSNQEELRKLQREFQGVEINHKQEVQKLSNQLKHKDIVIQKAKDALKSLSEKKDIEIKNLQAQISDNTENFNDKMSEALAGHQKNMQGDVNNLYKVIEQSKQKIEELNQSLSYEKSKNDVREVKSELHKLKSEKLMQESLARRFKNENEKLQGKLDTTLKELAELKKGQLEGKKGGEKVGGSDNEVSVAAFNDLKSQKAQVDASLKQIVSKNEYLQNKLRDVQAKNNELNIKVKRSAGDDSALKTRISQMETVVRKLTTDLTSASRQLGEAKKEANKYRVQINATQNKMKLMERELQKAKNAASGRKVS